MQKIPLKAIAILFTTFFAFSFIITPVNGALTWTVQEVTTYRLILENCALALDSAGHPWISYNDDAGLEVTHFTGTEWQTDIVDDTGDKVSAIAINHAGNRARIVYQDTTNYRLEYAQQVGTTWDISSVDTTCMSVNSLSIVTDSAGSPHIAYIDITDPFSPVLKYAWRDTAWHFVPIDADCSAMEMSPLQLDSTGNPCISYYDTTSGALLYIHKAGDSWLPETVDSSGGHEPSLRLRSDGQPGISYYMYDTPETCSLHYAYRDGGGWHSQAVDSNENVGYFSSLAFNSSNLPRISYFDDKNENLKYAYYDGTSWQSETVDSAGIAGRYTILALDSSNNPHISYLDVTTLNILKYAYVTSSPKLSVTPESDGVGVVVFSVLAAAGCYTAVKKKTR